MHQRRVCFAFAVVAALAFGGPASADVVYNDIDAVDVAVETMTLQYDTADHITGPNGQTILKIDVDGFLAPDDSGVDHPNCNISGGAHYLVITAAQTDGAVAGLSFPDGLQFDECSDTLRVVVRPFAVGMTTVSFSTASAVTAGDPKLNFDYRQAAFKVTVVERDLSAPDDGGGARCDRDPAAPAWANKFLKANDVKAKDRRGVVRDVAQEMGKRAAFPSGALMIAKNAHPEYEDAVHHYMETTLGLDLRKGPDDVRRPARVCTTIG